MTKLIDLKDLARFKEHLDERQATTDQAISDVEQEKLNKDEVELKQEPIIDANGYEYVDLGLPSGTLWATCNVGASTSEEYGGYYAWGETEEKNDYSWHTYKFGTSDNLKKYNATDGKTALGLEDDAAHVVMGGNWHMPTRTQCIELIDNTTSEWFTLNGIKGRRFTSKTNGNSIFIPAAGNMIGSSTSSVGDVCLLWTSLIEHEDVVYARFFQLDEGGVDFDDDSRSTGYSIRGVLSLDYVSGTKTTLTIKGTALEIATKEDVDEIVSPTLPEDFTYDPNEDSTIVTPLEKTYAYGVLIDWTEGKTSADLIRVGNMDLHRSLPIQSQFKRCLWSLDENKVAVYLDPDDSNYTENPRESIASWFNNEEHTYYSLRVHTPKFYVSVRILSKDSFGAPTKAVVMMSEYRLDSSYREVPEMATDFRNCLCMDETLSACPYESSSSVYGGYCKTKDQNLTAEEGVYYPITNLTRARARVLAGTYMTALMSYEAYKWLLFWCPVVEYATFNLTKPFIEELDENGFHKGGLGPGMTSIESQGNYNYYDVESRYDISDYEAGSSITANIIDSADYYKPTADKPVPFRKIGVTLNLGNHTGENLVEYEDSQRSGKMIHQNSYRGFEFPFGDLLLNLDGFIGTADTAEGWEHYWVTSNPEEFKDEAPSFIANYGSWKIAHSNRYTENGYDKQISDGDYDSGGYYVPVLTDGDLFPVRYYGREGHDDLDSNQKYLVNTFYPIDGTNGTVLPAGCFADDIDSDFVGPGYFKSDFDFSRSHSNLGFRCFNIIN